jgi:ribosomal protein S18 acetylase RimI-like enzyme
VDDIVVRDLERGLGIGRALMVYAEEDARTRGMTAIFLDARQQAIGFYDAVGYQIHSAPSMKKDL